MANITYIFGAGASANTLPIVNQIPSRIESLVANIFANGEFNELNNETPRNITVEKSRKEILNLLLDDMSWLKVETEKHASVDTLAKKFFITKKKQDLDRLKIALSAFFILEQARNKIDYRYDAFYASLLKSDIRSLPPHVKILSWNYDYQFELSFSAYSQNNDISTNQALLNIVHKNVQDSYTQNAFGIFKLNGSAALYQPSRHNHFHFVNSFTHSITLDILRGVIDGYANIILRPDVVPLLSFAWENEWGNGTLIDRATNATKESQTLVVIGYSFPFFNREIDAKILNNMTDLQKIYIQIPNPEDANSIKERIATLYARPAQLEFVIKHDRSQFLLPYEL